MTLPGPRPKSTWAQIASAFTSIIVLLAIFYQVRLLQQNVETANENVTVATSLGVYRPYQDAVLHYPQFVSPDYQEIKKNPIEFTRYKTFVRLMLFTYNEIIQIHGGSPFWLANFKRDVAAHREYVCDLSDPDLDIIYFPRTREIIDEIKKLRCN